ncbi:MAG: hypothetical protein ACLGSA_01235 [Acidobacteriota bacterium]
MADAARASPEKAQACAGKSAGRAGPTLGQRRECLAWSAEAVLSVEIYINLGIFWGIAVVKREVKKDKSILMRCGIYGERTELCSTKYEEQCPDEFRIGRIAMLLYSGNGSHDAMFCVVMSS